jgi:hypothetical protein
MLNEDQERIAQAAAFSVDTIDLYVQETLRVPANSPNLEKIISDHPLMRQEIDRQYSDLELLKETWKPAELRANWERPSQSNLGLRK